MGFCQVNTFFGVIGSGVLSVGFLLSDDPPQRIQFGLIFLGIK